MKRRILKAVLCFVMIFTMVLAPMTASAASVVRIMKINSDWVRMRSESGEQIARLRKGTKVLYWGTKNDEMYKVMTSNGKTGYVYKDYLTTYGAMRLSSVYITTAPTQMYKRSGASLKKNGTLATGKYVMVYKTSGNWAYIKTMSGKSAYVQKDTLKRAF